MNENAVDARSIEICIHVYVHVRTIHWCLLFEIRITNIIILVVLKTISENILSMTR